MTWHLDEVAAVEYTDRSTDPAIAASVETHLMACEQCRALVNSNVDAPTLAAVWGEIEDLLDVPRLGWIERAMLAIGCSTSTARIVAATTRARWSYLIVVALNVSIAIASSWSTDPDVMFTAFLLLAPLGPLVATAGAFGRWADPLHALLRTLPTSTWRVTLIRTSAAVVPAVILTSAATPWLAGHGWLAVAWLLPALALSLVTLALSSWVEIETASLLVAGTWLMLPIAMRLQDSDVLDAYAGPLQLVCAIAAICGAAMTLARRSTFDYGEF